MSDRNYQIWLACLLAIQLASVETFADVSTERATAPVAITNELPNKLDLDQVQTVRTLSIVSYELLIEQSFYQQRDLRPPKQFGCNAESPKSQPQILSDNEIKNSTSCLSEEEVSAVLEYRARAYGEWNSHLRSGKIPANVQIDIRHAASALNKIPSSPTLVFRGIRKDAAKFYDEYIVGSAVTEKAFTSTSLEPEVAKMFANGTGGIIALYLTKTCPYVPFLHGQIGGYESEVLCAPGKSFEVVYRSKRLDYTYIVLEEI